MEELAKYHHQTLCSPTKAALLQGIVNLQLRSFPGLTHNIIRKYLPQSTATDKGHTVRTLQDEQSTRIQQQDILDARQAVDDMNPPEQICTAVEDLMYCFAILRDTNNGKFHTNLCG